MFDNEDRYIFKNWKPILATKGDLAKNIKNNDNYID